MSRALGHKTRFGTLEEQHIRRAAARVLRTQFLLGELDGPSQVPQQKIDTAVVDSAEHRALALRAARESIVLLEHDGNTLPLAASARVAFIGPHVNTTQGFLSDYHGFRDVDDGPLQLARSRNVSVSSAMGCMLNSTTANPTELASAVSLAKRSEVAVVFVGLCGNNRLGPDGTPGCAGGTPVQETEGADRTSLELPGGQAQLLSAVLDTATPVVLVLITGGPLAVDTASPSGHHAAAVLYAPYGGQSGATAIIDTLLGASSPSGKSPVTWYGADFIKTRKSWDMDLRSGVGVTHLFYKGSPKWRFSHGLHYTSFTYRWAETPHQGSLSAASLVDAPSRWVPRVQVTNTGSRASGVVVLGFVNSSQPDFPQQKLFDYQRMELTPGEATEVQLNAQANTLAVVDEAGESWLTQAQFTVRIGDLLAPATAEFAVAGAPLRME